MTQNQALLKRNDILKNKVYEAISGLNTHPSSYTLLDFPMYSNIGDSAILLGEVDLLKRIHGRLPDYASTIYSDTEEPRKFTPDGLLYLSGGGNFGDIWPQHQLYREEIIKRYPHHRIVQLPQSIHYRDPAVIERTKRVIGSHGDFHLMVRDNVSLNLATKHFDCNVMLVPDCAFGLEMDLGSKSGLGNGTLCLFRNDQECRPDAVAAPSYFADAKIEDWVELAPRVWRRTMKLLDIYNKGFQYVPLEFWIRQRRNTMIQICESLVRAGFEQLSSAEVIVTDRLHGHIMASLLGKPHVVIDNFYGKIHNFIQSWPADSEVRVAKNYSEAREMADDLKKPVSL